jgi:hypothetical protein
MGEGGITTYLPTSKIPAPVQCPVMSRGTDRGVDLQRQSFRQSLPDGGMRYQHVEEVL